MEVIKVLKVLDDETRLKMVYILSRYCFCQLHLEQLLDINQANVSRNVNKLVETGILDFEMTNRKNRYFVTEKFKQQYSDVYSKIIIQYDNTPLNTILNNLENECEVINNGKN